MNRSSATALLPINLGIVTASLSSEAGGLFYSVRTPASLLEKAGSSVTVYGVRDTSFAQSATMWGNVSVHAFHHLGPGRLAFSPQMLSSVSRSDHDLLHQHGLWSFPSAVTSVWRRKTRRPVIISPRGMLDPWALRSSALRKRLASFAYERSNLEHASVIHALNESEAASIRSYGLRNSVAIIPNGVSLPDEAHGLETPPWMANDQRRVLLFLGRIHPKKGLKELLSAWALLSHQDPRINEEWRIVIAGWDDGDHLKALQVASAEAGLCSHVQFVGPAFGTDKAKALRHASAFILPSFSEGLPISVLEAWSYRLPVFMTRQCNICDAFPTGAAIEISTAPSDIAETLRTQLRSPRRLQIAGQAGRTLVETRYTWSRVVDDLSSLYEWVLRGGKPPSFVTS